MKNENEYMKYHIFELRRNYEVIIDHRSYTQNLKFKLIVILYSAVYWAVITSILYNWYNLYMYFYVPMK